jgi:hypothetical protein
MAFVMRRVLLLFLLAACTQEKKAPAWGPFPTSEDDARRLIAERTRRAVDGREAGPIDVVARVEEGAMIVGMTQVDAWLADRARAPGFYMLWGTHHDSAGQVEAFRRLTGPLAKTPWAVVALEQLRAGGHWSGLPPQAQRGDDDAIARSDLAELRTTQEREDYAAWKFGYVDAILGIVADGRAAKHEVRGCDMERSLQAKVPEHVRSPLRELHCALSLPQKTPAAILWGEEHVGADRFARYLPREANVLSIRVFGGREGPAEKALRERFDFVDPVLVPLGPAEALFVLADPNAARHFDRQRAALGAPHDQNLTLSSSELSSVVVDGRTFVAGTTPRQERVEPGAHTLSAQRGSHTLVASFVVPQSGYTEIRLEKSEPELTVIRYGP